MKHIKKNWVPYEPEIRQLAIDVISSLPNDFFDDFSIRINGNSVRFIHFTLYRVFFECCRT